MLSLSGVAQQGLDNGCMMMDARKEGGVVWHRGGVDGRPGKVDVSVPALKIDR